ncbi:MAG: hypothetical protein AABZ44_03815, partial [Elusimicrobiota bacterium]
KAKTAGELGNNFGNLHLRLLTMVNKYSQGPFVKRGAMTMFAALSGKREDIDGAYRDFEFHRALEIVYQGLASINLAIDKTAPWKLAKEGKTEEVLDFLSDCIYSLGLLAVWLSPVCPIACAKLLETFGVIGDPGKAVEQLLGQEPLRLASRSDPLFPKETIEKR